VKKRVDKARIFQSEAVKNVVSMQHYLVKRNLTREYGSARCEAIGILGDLGDKQFEPLITPFLDDEDYWTRQEAKKSLKKIQEKTDREITAISTILF